MHISLKKKKKYSIILRRSTKHAIFWLGVRTPIIRINEHSFISTQKHILYTCIYNLKSYNTHWVAVKNKFESFCCVHFIDETLIMLKNRYVTLSDYLIMIYYLWLFQHEAICEFPSRSFYDGRLITPPSVKNRLPLVPPSIWPGGGSHPMAFCTLHWRWRNFKCTNCWGGTRCRRQTCKKLNKWLVT